MIIAIGLFLLALLGTPLFSLFGAASISLFLSLPEGSWSSTAIDVFGAKFAENPTLMTIPLFTFAGYLLAEAGTPKRLVQVSRAWLGWLPGGLPAVCLMASAFFTTFTGGSGITIVAVGGLLLPALMSERYPKQFSLGLVTTGGSLGLLFPPSVPLILYGIIASLEMNKLLVAGIVPGMVVVFALFLYGAYVGVKVNVAREPFDLKKAWAALWHFKWEAAIPIVLVGGFASGLLRIHEASAFAAVYVLFIEVVVYRDIHFRRDLPRIIVESMTLVGAILVIMATAVGFTAWMIQAEIPMQLLAWMEQMITNKYMFLVVINLFLFVVGTLMDVFTATIVVVPLLLPMARAYGIDPYHMAIVFLLNLEIGYLTPPVGLNLFISSIRFGETLTTIARSVLIYIGILVASLLLVTYVPILTTWLPSMIKGDDLNAEIMVMGAGDDDTLKDEDFGMTDEDLAALAAEDDEEDAGIPEEAQPHEPEDEQPATDEVQPSAP